MEQVSKKNLSGLGTRLGLMGAFIPQNLEYYLKHPKGRGEMLDFLTAVGNVQEVTFLRMLLYYPFNSIKLVHNSAWVNAPWKTTAMEIKGRRGSTKKYLFNLALLNDKYWDNLELFLSIVKEMGIIPIISIIDFAQTHKKKHRQKSPYVLATNNVQNITMFDVDNFFEYLKPVLDKLTILYLKYNFLIELGNEYNFIDNRGDSAELLTKIASYLHNSPARIPYKSIMVPVGGIDKWHNLAEVSGHSSGDQIKHKAVIPAIHFGTREGWEKLKKDNGLRWMFRNYKTFLFSTDGARRRDNTPRGEVYWMRRLGEYMRNDVHPYVNDSELLFEMQPLLMWGPEAPSFDNVILGHYKLNAIKEDWLRLVVKLSPFIFRKKDVVDMNVVKKLLKSAIKSHKPSIWERFKRWMKGLL